MNMGQKGHEYGAKAGLAVQNWSLNKHWEHANKFSDLFCAPFSCIVG